MLSGLKKEWRKLKRAQPGRRFVEQYERHRARQAPWLKPIVLGSAVFAFAMALVLLVIPGASIVCAAVVALLLPFESRWVAASYDRIELLVRNVHTRSAAKSGHRDTHATPEDAWPETAELDGRQPEPQAERVQPPSDQHVVWIKPAAPSSGPVAATTKIWSADLPQTPPPIRRAPAEQPASVRPSRAVILVPPPLTITNHVDKPPAPAHQRATVPLRRRPRV